MTADASPLSRKTPLWATAIGGILLLARTRGRQAGSKSADQRYRPSDRPASGKTSSDDRGRDADAPTEIPARGWKDIALRIYRSLSEDRIVSIAAGATFYVLLAMFPAIAGLVSLYGLFADTASIARHLDLLAGILPEGGVQVIGEQIERLTAQPAPALGLAMIGTLAVSLWSANAGVKAIFDALNVVYREKEKRGFIKLNAISLALTVCSLLFLIVALIAIAVAPVVLSYLGLSDAAETWIGLARWPLLFAIAVLFAAVFYRFGPSRDQAKWRWITPGSVLAVLLWIVVSVLFSWYAANFGTYNKTYGSLGAVVGFMTWLWISITVVLLGGKFNAETEHQTARDTTEGRQQQIGERGANVADNVAPHS